MLYTAKNIYDIRYPGDGKLQPFMCQWNEILSHMDVKTVLPDDALLELLYYKGSKMMELDIHAFDNLARDDPARTYQARKDIANRHIRKEREETNRREREKALRVLARNATPAQSDVAISGGKAGGAQKAAPSRASTSKVKSGPNPPLQVIQVQVEAAAVLPSPSPKDQAAARARARGTVHPLLEENADQKATDRADL